MFTQRYFVFIQDFVGPAAPLTCWVLYIYLYTPNEFSFTILNSSTHSYVVMLSSLSCLIFQQTISWVDCNLSC